MLNDLIEFHKKQTSNRFFIHLYDEFTSNMRHHQESDDPSVIFNSLENRLPMGSVSLVPPRGHSIKGKEDYPIFMLTSGRMYTIAVNGTGCSVLFTANDQVFDYFLDVDLTPVFKSTYWLSGLIQNINNRVDFALRSYQEKYGACET